MLIRRTERERRRGNLAASLGNQSVGGLDRRTFLRRSGLAAGGLAMVGALPLAGMRKAEAAGTRCRPAPALPSARISARIVRSAAR